MKKYLLLIASVLLFAACSSPKYAYYFDHYDYNSGKKNIETPATHLAQSDIATPEMSPLLLDEQAVSASAESKIKPVEYAPAMVKEKAALLEQKYKSLSKTEKKEFRKELKSEIKKMIKAKKSGESINSIAEKNSHGSRPEDGPHFWYRWYYPQRLRRSEFDLLDTWGYLNRHCYRIPYQVDRRAIDRTS